MTEQGSVVIIGGTRAIGFEIVRHFASAGDDVVLTGQKAENVSAAVKLAAGLPGRVTGLTFDLAEPETIRAALQDVGPVRRLVLVAIDRDQNTVADYDVVFDEGVVANVAVATQLRTGQDVGKGPDPGALADVAALA